MMLECADDIADQIELVVRDRGAVTFADLGDIPGFTGNDMYLIDGAKFSNIVLWQGLSSEAIAALVNLISTGRIVAIPATALDYMAAGSGLDLPIVDAVRHFDKPHWLPAMLISGDAARAVA